MALVFKVGTLFIKTASKPLAGRFQKWVLGHPTYRQRVIDLAQVPELLFEAASPSELSTAPASCTELTQLVSMAR